MLPLLFAVAGVPEHGHCEMCSVPVAVGERRCGAAACEEKFKAALRAKKRGMYLFVGLIFVLLVLTQLGKF